MKGRKKLFRMVAGVMIAALLFPLVAFSNLATFTSFAAQKLYYCDMAKLDGKYVTASIQPLTDVSYEGSGNPVLMDTSGTGDFTPGVIIWKDFCGEGKDCIEVKWENYSAGTAKVEGVRVTFTYPMEYDSTAVLAWPETPDGQVNAVSNPSTLTGKNSGSTTFSLEFEVDNKAVENGKFYAYFVAEHSTGSDTASDNNTASGNNNTASDNNTASGNNNTASDNNTASGNNNTASDNNTASGNNNTASDNNTASGNNNTASDNNTASGNNNTASDNNTASGNNNTASDNNTASGNNNTASDNNSPASGNNGTASGNNGTASGNNGTASGNNSFDEEAYVKGIRDQMRAAATIPGGKRRAVTIRGVGAIRLDVIRYLKQNPDVDLTYILTYKEKTYNILLSGDDVILDESIPYYGPEYLIKYYYYRDRKDLKGAGYVIRKGDTLSKLAAKFRVPINVLAKKNGIKNINMIIAGKTLYY